MEEKIERAKLKVAFYTLGCKVNAYETNAMMNEFVTHGYEVVDFQEYADVYVVNTCTVTNMSDRKSRQILRRAKQKNPNGILCAVGCYAQVAKDELQKIEDIDKLLINMHSPNTFIGSESVEIKYDKQFESMCLLIAQKVGLDAKKMTVLQFYNAIDIIKKQIEAESKQVKRHKN